MFCRVVLYVSMSIHSEWRGVRWEGWGGLAARAEGEAPTHQSERALCAGWSAVRRGGWKPFSHRGHQSLKESVSPHEQPWGSSVQTRKLLNFLDHLQGLTAWDEWPVRKCHCYVFCWKLLEITLNSKPHRNMGSRSPAKPCAVLIFILHAQDWLCEEALLGFQKFSVTTGHTC